MQYCPPPPLHSTPAVLLHCYRPPFVNPYSIVSANNLTGELPLELNNLKVLKEVRLSSNKFRGRLPSFQSWRELEELELQATGFEGPIPSTISVSMNLNELMLRSCNITGKIPHYLAKFPELKLL
ncbi:hypothetical protein ACS0TY_017645 [Phlomoides rotata]